MEKKLAVVISTGLGAGYSPFAPGTAGAFVGAVLLYGWFHLAAYFGYDIQLNGFPFVLALLVCLLLGIWSTDIVEPEWGKDPSKVVIDEVLGMWVSMAFVSITIPNLLIAFFLFRLFDIWKPWPIRKLESLPGGWGVMLDDLLAGIYANICMHLYLYWFG